MDTGESPGSLPDRLKYTLSIGHRLGVGVIGRGNDLTIYFPWKSYTKKRWRLTSTKTIKDNVGSSAKNLAFKCIKETEWPIHLESSKWEILTSTHNKCKINVFCALGDDLW